MAKVTIKDKNRMPELERELRYLWDHKLEIGIFGDDDSFILMIARVHEFGVQIEVTPRMRAYLHYIGIHLKPSTTHVNIPERSYMRATVDNKKADIEQVVEYQVRKVYGLEQTAQEALGKIGTHVVGMVQRRITDLREPPNHPATVARKGSSNPLIDTGRLRQSITWRIVEA